uniref:Secreted protein n=1 Tax=Phakopsora pachyrhizi TaxID=170000 RepID=A0A0S1MIM2_PHAPC
MGFVKVVLLLCMWEAVLFFAFKENQASPFDFMDADNVHNKAQGKMDGWTHLEDSNKGSVFM